MSGRRRPDQDWLTTGEIALAVGVCPKTVKKWIDSGDLPGIRLPGGGGRRVSREEFDRFRMARFPSAEAAKPIARHDEIAGALVVQVDSPDCVMRCECQATFRSSTARLLYLRRQPNPPQLRCFGCRSERCERKHSDRDRPRPGVEETVRRLKAGEPKRVVARECGVSVQSVTMTWLRWVVRPERDRLKAENERLRQLLAEFGVPTPSED